MGDPLWVCGWGGGRSPSITFGQTARDSPSPGSPFEDPGPGALEEVPWNRSPLVRGEAALGAGVPPPAASFPSLLPGSARRPQLCLGAAAGAGWTGLSPEDPRVKSGSAAGHPVSSEVRPLVLAVVPSFASPLGWRRRDFTCFSFEYVTEPGSWVIFFPSMLLSGGKYIDVYLKAICPRCYPGPLRSFHFGGNAYLPFLDHRRVPF